MRRKRISAKKNMLILLLCVSVLSVALPISAWATSANMDAPMETTAPQTIDETTVSLCAVCQEENCTREHVSCGVCEGYDCDIHAGESDSVTIQTGCAQCGLFGDHAPGCPNAPAMATETVTEVYHPKKTDGSDELDMTTIVGFPSTGILENGVTYKLTTNITTCFPLTVEAGSTVTIDLNGLMLEGKGEKPVITVEVDVTYSDNTVTAVNSYGTLYIKNSDTTPGNTITGYVNSENVWSRSNSTGATKHPISQACITNRGTGMGIKVSGKLYLTGNETNKILIIGCKSPDTDPGAAICGTSTAIMEIEYAEICYNRTTREYTNSQDDEGNPTTMVSQSGVVHSEQQYSDVPAYLKATNCLFHNNSSKGRGGAVSGGNITLIGCVMKNNVAFRGGAVCANQSLIISGNSVIKNNQATDLGGGVSFESSKKENLSISDTEISGNSVTGTNGQVVHGVLVAGSGGGVQSTSEITLTNCVIKDNEASNNGGGVYTTTTITLNNCTISGNSAEVHGGGIYVVGELTVTDGSITGNRAGRGGGIYVGSNSIVKGNAVISLNESLGYTDDNDKKALGYGGGVYVASQSSEFVLTDNAKLEYNTAADNGGGIYCSGVFKLSGNAVVQGNETPVSGAGVYAAWLEMTGGTVQDNHATKSGGGLAATFHFKITGGTIKANTSGGSGAGVIRIDANAAERDADKVNIISNCTIEGNISGDNGGGVFLGSYSLEISNAIIKGNEAAASGGGIYVQRGNATDYNAYLEITNGTKISENKAKGGVGGGIFMNAVELRIAKSKINGNTASQNGAGICTLGVLQITDGTEISANIADLNGGGIYCKDNPSIVISNVTIENNEANNKGGGVYLVGSTLNVKADTVFSGNSSEYLGGAIASDENTVINLEDGSVLENNTAANNGGAVYSAGKVNMNGGAIIRNNTAAEAGGGICAVNINIAGTASKKAEITGNTAKYGGGIYATSELVMDYAWIENNTAEVYGGGVQTVANSTATVTNSTITGNKAVPLSGNSTGRGGGMFVFGTADFTNTTISSNTALRYGGGLQVDAGAVVTWNSGSIDNNTALTEGAGGIHVFKGTFTMKDGTISGNNAHWVGGGIHGNEANIIIEGGTISNNTVTAGEGGGIHINLGTTLHVISGTISGNRAVTGKLPSAVSNSNGEVTVTYEGETVCGSGGGIYVNGAEAVIGVEGCSGTGTNHSVTYPGKIHPVITDNTADDSAGGIGMVNNATVMVYCAGITDNTAMNAGRGDNIYSDGQSLTVYHADIGTDAQPGLVAVNGTVQREDTPTGVVLRYYRTNTAESPDKTAQISENEVFHLPDAEKYWSESGIFVGWTFHGPAYEAAPYVRDSSQYMPVGTPLTAADVTDGYTSDNTVHMYALWAPQTSTITYYGSIVDDVFRAEALATNGSNPTSYTFTTGSNGVVLKEPVKAGYTFVGWYVYQNENQNANWGYEADNMHYFSKDTALELGNSHFGDITLIPCFTENTVIYTYYMVGPQGTAGFGTLLAQDSNVGSGYTYTIKADSGTPNAVTATATHRYKFVGWYSDAACTQQVTAANALEVQKTDGLYTGGTFYAKFDYYLDDLTITCDTTGFFRDQQHFVYEVWHGSEYVTTVVLKNGESVVIRDLVIGEEYTVKCIETWSWRFVSGISEATQTVTLSQGGHTAIFRNTQQRHIWLTHDTYGWFGKTGNG